MTSKERTYTAETTAFLEMVKRGDFLVLDTETTGLDRGEIIQIAIVDCKGNVLLDSLVHPVKSIPNTDIRGISDADVANAPRWTEIAPTVESLVRGRDLIVYNAVYDRKMMHQSNEASLLPKVAWKEITNWHCAMLAYAEIYGDWNDYHHSYRWQRLTDAVIQQGLNVSNAHTALGDAMMTLELVKKIAGE